MQNYGQKGNLKKLIIYLPTPFPKVLYMCTDFLKRPQQNIDCAKQTHLDLRLGEVLDWYYHATTDI